MLSGDFLPTLTLVFLYVQYVQLFPARQLFQGTENETIVERGYWIHFTGFALRANHTSMELFSWPDLITSYLPGFLQGVVNQI